MASCFGASPRRQLLVIAALLFAAFPSFAAALQDDQAESVPPEEYPIYDLVIQTKFLTSQTVLVLIDRMTVTKLGSDDNTPTPAFFEEHRFFGGAIPADAVTDFAVKARKSWRLESRFKVGVRYRFVSGDKIEEPEVSLAPLPVGRQQGKFTGYDPAQIGVLKFSRVGFNRRENQALVYVGDHRPDGSGGGFLVFLRRDGQSWMIVDTEVLWAARAEP